MRYTQFSGEPVVQDRAEYEAAKARVDALDARYRAGLISEDYYHARREELLDAANREVGFARIVSVASIEGGLSDKAVPIDVDTISAVDLAELKSLIGTMTQPAFAVDAEGQLVAWNTLLTDAAGVLDEQRTGWWPFSNALFDERGRALDPDDSPTRECLRTRKIVRGRKVAMEDRDGRRILGAGYPTPIWSRTTKRFLGVVTVWVPLSEVKAVARPQLRVLRQNVASWFAVAASVGMLASSERLLTRVDWHATYLAGVDWYTVLFGLAPVA